MHAAPPPAHVFVVVMENHGYSSVVGNPAAPWIDEAVRRFGVALNYRAVAHPSQPNYLALTSGSTHGVTSDADVSLHVPNVGSQLTAKHEAWRAYMQSSPGARKHDPFVSYGETRNVVDLSQLGRGTPPRFGFVVPDECHDMHGAPGCGDLVRTGDRFLARTVARIRRWAPRSLIFVTWDEDEGGSNRVLTLVIGGRDAKSQRAYDHYSLLRTIEQKLGLGCLAFACRARPMTDLTG